MLIHFLDERAASNPDTDPPGGMELTGLWTGENSLRSRSLGVANEERIGANLVPMTQLPGAVDGD